MKCRNADLVLLALFGDNVGGLLLFEDFTFAVTDFLGLGSAEVIVVQSVRNRNPGNVDLIRERSFSWLFYLTLS